MGFFDMNHPEHQIRDDSYFSFIGFYSAMYAESTMPTMTEMTQACGLSST